MRKKGVVFKESLRKGRISRRLFVLSGILIILLFLIFFAPFVDNSRIHGNAVKDSYIQPERLYNVLLKSPALSMMDFFNEKLGGLYGIILGNVVNGYGSEKFLVAHYSFEGNANDLIGNIDGTLFGNANVGDNKLVLDGVGDYVDFGDNDLDYEEFSVSLWTKATTNDPSDSKFPIHVTNLIGEGNWNSVNNWYLGYKSSGANPATHLSFVYGTRWMNGPSISVESFDLSERHHIVGVASKNELKLYLDGELVDTKTITHGSVANTYNMQMGRSSYVNRYFNGEIDDVKIWNYGLSVSEISEEYGVGVPEVEGGKLVAHYSFEGNANDVSGNGYDGQF